MRGSRSQWGKMLKTEGGFSVIWVSNTVHSHDYDVIIQIFSTNMKPILFWFQPALSVKSLFLSPLFINLNVPVLMDLTTKQKGLHANLRQIRCIRRNENVDRASKNDVEVRTLKGSKHRCEWNQQHLLMWAPLQAEAIPMLLGNISMFKTKKKLSILHTYIVSQILHQI